MLTLALLMSAPMWAQTAPCQPAPQSAWEVEHERLLHTDWAELGHFRQSNAKLSAPAPGERRVVFMGDSITEGWRATARPVGPEMGAFFAGRPYLNRGISGQTTAQMLVRFRPDVIALQPRAVVLLAGTNDIAGNTGEVTLETIEANLSTMAELARAHHIRVVLVSVLPAAEYGWRPGRQPAPKILALNRWLGEYAAAHGYLYVDLHTAMSTPEGAMRRELSGDGVHPNHVGYALMERLLRPVVERAVR
jgi:lysophospholipase L1-like esterase